MVGRVKEARQLNTLYESGRPELVAVFGRRRVGKTYLVDETFKGRITFRHAGLSPIDQNGKGALAAQLEHFFYSLKLQGATARKKPASWIEAFFLLEQHLESIDDGSRQLVFIDELPWLDTPRSGFVTAFEAFWNTWACHRDNVMVVVCGSASSWILDKLVNNRGGLYNRVTYEMELRPFDLAESEAFLQERGVALSRYDIAQAGMVVGGIPYYLGYFQRGLSLAQNVDALFFAPGAKLSDEYARLFSSIFDDAQQTQDIVSLLGENRMGFTRSAIVKRLDSADGARLSDNLRALEASGFVVRYVPFGQRANTVHYKLVDAFCKFYLRFCKDASSQNANFWQQNVTSQAVATWRGLAFEDICFNHIDKIKAALGISGVTTSQSAWSAQDEDGDDMQIDLLISRNDDVVNMCEAKFYSDDFTVTKGYYRQLLRRQEALAKRISPKSVVHSTLITTFGLRHNEYGGAFTNVVTLDDLFR